MSRRDDIARSLRGGNLGERVFAAIWLGSPHVELRPGDVEAGSWRLEVGRPRPAMTFVNPYDDQRAEVAEPWSTMSFEIDWRARPAHVVIKASDEDRAAVAAWLDER